MSDVEFQEDYFDQDHSFKSRSILGAPEKPGMIGFITSTGLVKDEITAGYILVGIAIASFLASVGIIYYFFFYHPQTKQLFREDLPIELRQNAPEIYNSLPSKYDR